MRTRVAVRNSVATATIALIFLNTERVAVGENHGGYESEQGTHIFGVRDETLEGVQISYGQEPSASRARHELRIEAGRLYDTLGSDPNRTDIVGMRLAGKPVATVSHGGEPITATLIITSANPHANMYTGELSPTVWEYHVMVQDGEKLTPLCDDDKNAALVVPGNWDNGALKHDNTWFTFSCVPILIPDAVPTKLVPPDAVDVRTPASGTRIPERSLAVGNSTPPVAVSHAATPLPGKRPPAPAPHVVHGKPLPAPAPHVLTQLGVQAIPRLSARFTMDERRSMGLPLDEKPQRQWRGGAAAKCIDYGYAPWTVRVSSLTTTRSGRVPEPGETARRFHNLCTRAFTADYAGNGHSHTISGTAIRVYDLRNLPVEVLSRANAKSCSPSSTVQSATSVSGSLKDALSRCAPVPIAKRQYADLRYEGAWFVDLAGNARALCLSKARWQTLDAHDAQLSPAHSYLGPDTWTYCEEGTLATLEVHDTVLVSYSAITEKGLYRFRQGGGASDSPSGWIVTSHVQATANGIEIDLKAFDPSVSRNPCTATPQALCNPIFEGNILSPEVPLHIRAGFKTVPLYRYKNAHGDYMMTVTESHAVKGYTPEKEPDGHLFAADLDIPECETAYGCAQTPGLRLSHRDNSYCTSVGVCAADYKDAVPLGSVLVPGLDQAIVVSKGQLISVRPVNPRVWQDGLNVLRRTLPERWQIPRSGPSVLPDPVVRKLPVVDPHLKPPVVPQQAMPR